MLRNFYFSGDAPLTTTSSSYVSNRVLKIQVGFLLSEGVGKSVDMEFDVPSLRLDADLTLSILRGSLHLSRTSYGILVQGELRTTRQTECRRCLDEVEFPVRLSIEELFVSPPKPDAEFTVADDGILDLTPLLRQEVILAMPLGVLCKPDCAGLCPTCGTNLNDGPCDCTQDTIDPRFAALKALKTKNDLL
ncbi:MAG TPA: DUF177 domain-containing protein [Aggregatilineales bacterium]|nr:DUF177 domain-containing protein [Aggregatilineales bacterium]